MTFSNLYKQLKRRLKARKRWLSLGAFLLIAAGAAGGWMMAGEFRDGPGTEAKAVMSHVEPEDTVRVQSEAALAAIRQEGISREVVLHTQYVCGEEQRQLGLLPPKEIASLRSEQPDARVTLDTAGKVHFINTVEDLGPRCKENAYFGMDKDGNLTLFDGIPEHERVIRTFFQLDVEHMKSSLPTDAMKQLHTGIRITDLADYNSVLSTFVEYAAEQAEPVTNHKH